MNRAGSRRTGDMMLFAWMAWAGHSRANERPFSELFWTQKRWAVVLGNTTYQGRYYNFGWTQPLQALVVWSVLATQGLIILKIVLCILVATVPAPLFLALAFSSLLCYCKREHEEQTCFYHQVIWKQSCIWRMFGFTFRVCLKPTHAWKRRGVWGFVHINHTNTKIWC